MDRMFSIDRFEGELAVLEQEDGRLLHVLRSFLPDTAREGDRIAYQNGAWTILQSETEQLRDELFDLQESLFDE